MCGQFAAFCFSSFCCLFVFLQRTTLLKRTQFWRTLTWNCRAAHRALAFVWVPPNVQVHPGTTAHGSEPRHMQCKVRCQNHTCKYVSGHSATSLLAMYSSIQLLETCNSQWTVIKPANVILRRKKKISLQKCVCAAFSVLTFVRTWRYFFLAWFLGCEGIFVLTLFGLQVIHSGFDKCCLFVFVFFFFPAAVCLSKPIWSKSSEAAEGYLRGQVANSCWPFHHGGVNCMTALFFFPFSFFLWAHSSLIILYETRYSQFSLILRCWRSFMAVTLTGHTVMLALARTLELLGTHIYLKRVLFCQCFVLIKSIFWKQNCH